MDELSELEKDNLEDGLPEDAENKVVEYVLQKHRVNLNEIEVDDAIFWKYIAPAYKDLWGYEFPKPKGKADPI